MKRIIGIILFCLIAFGTVQFVDYYKDSQLSNSEKSLKEYFDDEGHIISILMPERYYYGNPAYNDLQSVLNIIVMKEFDFADKVSVKIVELDVETREEYLREKNLLLSSKSGPTLIMVDLAEDSMDEYIDYGIALEVDDKLKNFDHLFEFLKNKYYVSLGMYSIGTIVDTDIIEEMGESIPTPDWTKEDFYRLQSKWFEDHDVFIEYYEFERVYNYYFMATELIDLTGTVRFNTDENIDKIIQIRDQFISTDYKTHPNIDITELQDMLNLNFEDAWGWNQYFQQENSTDHFVMLERINALHPYSTYHPLLYRPVKLLPTVHRGDSNVTDMGFLVNRKGLNTEFGLQLLDLLISDEYQYYIYEKKFFNGIAPSISTIEEQIKNKHPRQIGNVEKKVAPFAFEARDQMINDLKTGVISVNRKSREALLIEESFKRFVVEMAFNEDYFDRQEIIDRLKKFEREVYLQLNE